MKTKKVISKQSWIKTAFMAIAVIISSYGFAQSPGGSGAKPDGPPPIPNQQQVEVMVDDLSNELSLTENQEDQVLDLFTAHFNEVRAKTSGNSKPDRDEMEAIRLSFEDDMKKVLTDEQFKDFQEYSKKKKHKQKRQ